MQQPSWHSVLAHQQASLTLRTSHDPGPRARRAIDDAVRPILYGQRYRTYPLDRSTYDWTRVAATALAFCVRPASVNVTVLYDSDCSCD